MLIRYIIKRILISIPVLLVISFAVFMIIELPPGSYLDTRIEQMQNEGQVDTVQIEALRQRFHFDWPASVRYVYWIKGFVTGDFGKSFEDDTEVTEILAKYLPVTAAISVFTIILTWSIAVPLSMR